MERCPSTQRSHLSLRSSRSGRQAGIQIENRLKTDEKITVQFSDVPLAEAVARLANVMLVYDKDPDKADPAYPRSSYPQKGRESDRPA
jgi:hypothetical protein